MKYHIKTVKVKTDFDRRGTKSPGYVKLYVDIDEQSVMEQFMNRGTEPYRDYKKFVLPKVMKRLAKNESTSHLVDSKWSWDSHCGCTMCPCSPGFISSERGYETIYVLVKITE